MLKVIRTVAEMQRYADAVRSGGRTLGFVPTMGALHEGHLSLVQRACRENNVVVVSLFVNPLQFGPKEDFKAYPRSFKRDRQLLEDRGVDVLFFPSRAAMYSKGFCTYVLQEGLTATLCGRSRPTHFQGVTTVVAKLFHAVKPHRSYFGQKDAQQAMVIKRMVKDLNMDIRVAVLPIVREADGLAMSSRNAYLKGKERQDALCLVNSLRKAEGLFKRGERSSRKILAAIRQVIRRVPSARIDYVSVVDPQTLQPVSIIGKKALVALAVFVGKVRLIDNTILRG